MMNEFCKGGGCTAKLGPGILDKVLKMIPKKADPKLLVGFDHSDDAAVYQLTDELAVVQTLDFFPPMVEDPYLFGKIAATNALSDIYAMGGEVKTALNIVCFPESMDANILGQILLGGNEKVTEAGGVLAGGHSINDVDVKYGLSVMGTIHPKRILENNHCKEGDLLLLTKPLGVGIVMTASRMKAVSEEAFDQANGYDDKILSISCNLDDMTGEDISFAAETLLNAGALDVYTIPIQMKKGRPGIILTCLCPLSEKENFTNLFFQHTTTRGIRYAVYERVKLVSTFETKETPYGKIRIKKSSGYHVNHEKPEFEDLKAIAFKQGCSLKDVRNLLD